MKSTGKLLTRRSIIQSLAFGTTAAMAGSLSACAGTNAKESPVWLNMNQQELNDAYSQYIHAKNIGQVIDRWGTNSELARSRLGEPLKFKYGAGPAESLDVYPTSQANAPVNIWRWWVRMPI